MSEQAPPLAGVIGWPIGHSKSPIVHGYWLEKYGISGAYMALPIAPEYFESAVRMLPHMGFKGANVTLPHKEAAYAICDTYSETAQHLGAVNTLIFKDKKIHGDNTDGFGFIENLHQESPNWQPKAGPAVVFGAGGAARSVVDSLLRAGVPELRLLNRTKSRAETLAAQIGGTNNAIKVVDWDSAECCVADATILVNTTSLGMEGQPDFPFSLANASAQALATDIVYTPLKTPFLQRASENSLQIVDGLGMLLHQARPGFEAWFRQRAEVDSILRQRVLQA